MVGEDPTGMAPLRTGLASKPEPMGLHSFWRVQGRLPGDFVSCMVGPRPQAARGEGEGGTSGRGGGRWGHRKL